MFNKLATAKHENTVEADHLKLITEAADDSSDMEELDELIDSDGESVSQEEVDSLEDLVGSLSSDPDKNISKMSEKEITSHIKKVESPSIDELDE